MIISLALMPIPIEKIVLSLYKKILKTKSKDKK